MSLESRIGNLESRDNGGGGVCECGWRVERRNDWQEDRDSGPAKCPECGKERRTVIVDYTADWRPGRGGS